MTNVYYCIDMYFSIGDSEPLPQAIPQGSLFGVGEECDSYGYHWVRIFSLQDNVDRNCIDNSRLF